MTLAALLLPIALSAAPVRQAATEIRAAQLALPAQAAGLPEGPSAAWSGLQPSAMAAPDAPQAPPAASRPKAGPSASGGASSGGPSPDEGSGLMARARAMADYFLRGDRRDAVHTAAAALLAVRDYHSLPSQSRERTVAALNALREFRLSTGHSVIDPGFQSRLTAASGGSARLIERTAAHVRGIELNGFKSDNTVDDPDSRQRHVLGVALSGREAIAEFNADLDRSRDVLRQQLNVMPYHFERVKRLLRAVAAPAAAALSPVLALAGVDPWKIALGATALVVINEPYAVLRNHLAVDRWYRAAKTRASGFLAGGDGWAFDSRTYAVQGDLVDTILKAGKSPELLRLPLWNQDYHGSHGLYARFMKIFLYRRHAAGDATLLADIHNGESDRWVTVDRLLWKKPGAEPLMAVTVRTSSTRPKFPKAAREKSPAFSWTPAPQPIAVPVPARPDRRR